MEDLAAELLPWLRIALIATFASLTLAAPWAAARFGPAAWWGAAGFGALSLALFGFWVPVATSHQLPWWGAAATVALLLLFPYLLLRFTASFRPLPWWIEALAGATTVLGVLATVVGFSIPAAQRGAIWDLYVPVALAYWITLSLISALRLWRAGRGQPTVARRRMRLMSIATTVLAAALVVEVAVPLIADVFSMGVLLAAMLSATAFGLGFYPPRSMRLAWRQPEERYVQQSTIAVLRATTKQEVARELLPPTVRVVGGSGAALVDDDDVVVASYGRAPAVGTTLAASTAGTPRTHATREAVPLGGSRGSLVVWTSRYAPFFGHEEITLLRNMAAIARLALERAELLEAERQRLQAMEQAQREAEAAQQEATRANTAKSEFVSRMSHELRTPLNAILGFGQLLEISEDLNADDREAVHHVLKAGRHLLALINDVLDLSRIEAGKLTISVEPVHSGELVEDAVALIQPLAERRQITVSVDPSSFDEYVATDRQRSRQVLLNLLSNAVKYNRDGGEVHVRSERAGEDRLRIYVRDTGPGIEPGLRDRLFEPFDRLGAEASGVEGTGLGLALSKQLIERLGGSIAVDSAGGEGSTFWIELPLSERPADVVETPTERPHPTDSDARTLLLVEDNFANLRVVEAMLRQRPNMVVLPAMQGELATDLASEHHPDVIVLDLHLPDIPGHEVLGRLQADPRTRDIPVVIASADATPRSIRQLQEQGAFDYVTKPLDMSRFLEVVDSAVDHHDLVHPRQPAAQHSTPMGPAAEPPRRSG